MHIDTTSTLTSKGQTTIPQEIRALLDLQTGDELLYTADPVSSFTYIQKLSHLTPCPICEGIGTVEGHLCFRCNGKRRTSDDEENFLSQLKHLIRRGRRFDLKVSISNDLTNETDMPDFHIESDEYSETALARIRDYFIYLYTLENIPKSTDPKSPTGFMSPSDSVMQELIRPFYTDYFRNKLRDRLIPVPKDDSVATVRAQVADIPLHQESWRYIRKLARNDSIRIGSVVGQILDEWVSEQVKSEEER